MKRAKLTDTEIRETVEKIRQQYADYMVRFLKPREALAAFEDRYIEAMRARMDLTLFLFAERGVIKELIEKEEEREREEQERKLKTVAKRKENKSIADRVLEEHRRMIAKYPPLAIHNDGSEELQKLYGAIGAVEREFWPDIEGFMRKAYTSFTSPRDMLESHMLQLCRLNTEGIPPRLTRYKSLFDRFPRNYPEIEKEEKKCIVDAAHLLHSFETTFKELFSSEKLAIQERQKVEEMADYVHSVIKDFRLKELKPTNR